MAPVNLIINWCYNLLNILLDIVTLGAAEGYLGERFADGFAASYGFGEALTSALGKFDGNGISYDNIIDDAVGSIPIVSHLYAAACIAEYVVLYQSLHVVNVISEFKNNNLISLTSI